MGLMRTALPCSAFATVHTSAGTSIPSQSSPQ
jgi:hypothetical protein